MTGTLVHIIRKGKTIHNPTNTDTFKGDSLKYPLTEEFREEMWDAENAEGLTTIVPRRYLRKNAYEYFSNQIFKTENIIYVGEYINHGVIIPSDFGTIHFDELYNCPPLISHVKAGNEDYISFLHVWFIKGDKKIVDMQVKHWMMTLSEIGDVVETIFAPRHINGSSNNTLYQETPNILKEHSKRSVIFTRNLNPINGILNGIGIYMPRCGYHQWKD